MSVSAVVMAAGEGKRMHTRRAKVLHEAAGQPLLDWVLDALAPLDPRPVVVVIGHLRDQVSAHIRDRGLITAAQDPPRGTGDAVMQAVRFLPTAGEVLVVSGDVPLVTSASLRALLAARRHAQAACAVTTAILQEPGAYGRIQRDPSGNVAAIVEARDAAPDTLAIHEVNVGAYAFDLASLRPLLDELSPDNAQGEYYLTDVIGLAVRRRWPVAASVLADADEMIGVNTRADLAQVHRLLNTRLIASLLASGVSVLNPATTWIEIGCSVDADTVLEPGVHLRRGATIGRGCRIGAHSVLDGVTIPDGAVVPPLTHLTKG